jgi:hypothetical protein
MSAKYPTVSNMLAEQFEEVARSEHTQQIISASQLTVQEAPPLNSTARLRREDLWKDVVSQYPEAGLQSAPPPPEAAPLAKIEIDTGYITFGGGVPVGGFSHLTIYSDGSYGYTGHFHVSGAPSYNYGLVWVVKDSQGRPFSFSHGGRLHGTFESGPRDDDWAFTNTDQRLAQFWPDIAAGYSWAWKSAVNIDLRAILNSAVETLGTAVAVIAIVA